MGFLLFAIFVVIAVFVFLQIIKQSQRNAEQEERERKIVAKLWNFNAHCNYCDFRRKARKAREGRLEDRERYQSYLCGVEINDRPQNNVCRYYEGPVDKYECPQCSGSNAYYSRDGNTFSRSFICGECRKKTIWTEILH